MVRMLDCNWDLKTESLWEGDLTFDSQVAASVDLANRQFVVSFISGIGSGEDQPLFGSLCNHLDSVTGCQQFVVVVPFDRADVLS